MRPSKSKKKGPVRAAKAAMFSTSNARANFAHALGLAHRDNAVIGFDRYGRRVAALVPMAAVLMLAGRGSDVEPAIREKIERMARVLAQATVREDAPVRGVARATKAKKKAPARGRK